ncbi:unnamed protein product [Triticum turgidum subsp. durum]|uniref:Uncharacterized protein n=1 Tax=Triticum turgidum subsp. durum TaxID=4567 RepID=A0A9R0S8R1_TRITD|nr:unnamed protein product [Triticum turgidum subsp. durum]
MAAEGASGSSGASDVERMMAELGLKEEDLDDVIFDEKDAPPQGPRWIALARVNTSKSYSQTWFYRNMRSAWNIAQEAKFKPLEDNLYSVQLSCLGAWNFQGDAVLLAPYDGVSKPSSIKLETIDIWIMFQICLLTWLLH